MRQIIGSVLNGIATEQVGTLRITATQSNPDASIIAGAPAIVQVSDGTYDFQLFDGSYFVEWKGEADAFFRSLGSITITDGEPVNLFTLLEEA